MILNQGKDHAYAFNGSKLFACQLAISSKHTHLAVKIDCAFIIAELL